MGQYYKPINIDKKEYLLTHSYGNGLKLMEHSYINNDVLNAVENLLIPGGAWHRAHIVWAGDYADPEPHYRRIENSGIDKGDPKNTEEEVNLYGIIDSDELGSEITPTSDKVDPQFHYLVNHTKKEVVDLNEIEEDSSGYKIHPLALLTCEGNGRGGGDFRSHNEEGVGSWARDSISLENHMPVSYTGISGQFYEE